MEEEERRGRKKNEAKRHAVPSEQITLHLLVIVLPSYLVVIIKLCIENKFKNFCSFQSLRL